MIKYLNHLGYGLAGRDAVRSGRRLAILQRNQASTLSTGLADSSKTSVITM